MEVILTHEQADMDALASQLGAWLLFPEALPILPRNINRNGRRYLKRFGNSLPHIEYEDMPRKPIDTVFLVDTQSLITLKGMKDKTRIVVYDHHPKKDDINPDWELHLEKFGANVSQLVSRIREKKIPLNEIQATTLALGLYEDTGSFTYRSTTNADLQAAAFCIQNGANLDIVGEFLYPPLSAEQRKLYNRLMKLVQTFRVEDQTIMTVKADALDVQDEISSVAHKMRDVLDPDALLLLVSTTQGIRLVARSTSDRVDVSSIAEEMGGGGHKRAASALMRPEEKLNEAETRAFLDRCFEKMVSNLDQHVQSAVTVASIMSKDPLILTPETSAREAHLLMQRYGYEGYPVVSGETVVGLLNRREVDRALSHGLDLTVESLMAAGNVSISPEASLESLQSLMGATGWGQVPVVLEETGEIIGIVTRTDLLKTLSPHAELPSQKEVSRKLSEAIPPARLALLHTLAEEADRLNLPVFVVGGFVRDLLLDRPSLDFDVVVEGDAIFFAKRLVDQFGGRVLTHKRFGTAKWDISEVRDKLIKKLNLGKQSNPDELPDSLDLITARTEFYEQPAALPTVESSSIKMDLHRRDFTINTLSLRLDGEYFGMVYDYWGGLSDLRKGHICVLHALSFVDDATRLLRGVRFEQRFGFQIEQRTLDLMEESLPLLNKVTGARLRHEINQILEEPKAPSMLARLNSLGILKAIHPALPWDDTINDHLKRLNTDLLDPAWNLPQHPDGLNLHQTLSYLVWLGQLPEMTLRSIVSRLRFKSDIRKLLISTSQLIRSLAHLEDAKPSEVTRRLEKVPRISIYAAYLINDEPAFRESLWKYVNQWAGVTPHTTGDDLRKLGLPPSPAYGEILSSLRNAWLDGEIQSLEEEKGLLSDLVKDKK